MSDAVSIVYRVTSLQLVKNLVYLVAFQAMDVSARPQTTDQTILEPVLSTRKCLVFPHGRA